MSETESNAASFDLFRLNCFLNDTQANDFKRIILSLINEFLFDNGNKDTKVNDCYKHITEYHKIEIEKDYLVSIIEKSDSIEKNPIDHDILIKLTPDKNAEIYERLKEHSIDVHIDAFLQRQGHDSSLAVPLKSLLYQAVYENIHTFSTENLATLISVNIHNNFKKEHIRIFNEFLDEKNQDKNTAVYNVFLKATEFAIITSGKGVKEFSKDLFTGKTYYLDTNILFRLLGIGGEERRKSLENLIKACVHQGIRFEYTSYTYKEFKSKLDGIIKYLKTAEVKYDFKSLGDLLQTEPQLFNDDFITHYSKLRIDGVVSSPDQYELRLMTEFRLLERKSTFSLNTSQINITERERTILAEHLYKSKKTLSYVSHYTRTAANVDAYNILFVRKFRGTNNYNYADVKSFYLSTDRTLNNIQSKDKSIRIPETILPSQLFILHNPSGVEDNDIDYELFLQFLKRRSTEFQLKGGDVLMYIDTIRGQVSSKTEMSEILKAFADKRYESSDDHGVEKRKIRTFREVMETVLDERLQSGAVASQKIQDLRDNSLTQMMRIVNGTKWTMRCFDIGLAVVLIPLSVLLLRALSIEPWLVIVLTLLIEVIKFLLTSKTPVLRKTWKWLLTWRLKSSAYYRVTGDNEFLANGLAEYEKLNGDIWKFK